MLKYQNLSKMLSDNIAKKLYLCYFVCLVHFRLVYQNEQSFICISLVVFGQLITVKSLFQQKKKYLKTQQSNSIHCVDSLDDVTRRE